MLPSMGANIAERTTPKVAAGGLLTKSEVAQFLGVTERTVENFCRRGLPFYRLGPRRNRYDLAAVRAWLDRTCRITRVEGGAS